MSNTLMHLELVSKGEKRYTLSVNPIGSRMLRRCSDSCYEVVSSWPEYAAYVELLRYENWGKCPYDMDLNQNFILFKLRGLKDGY